MLKIKKTFICNICDKTLEKEYDVAPGQELPLDGGIAGSGKRMYDYPEGWTIVSGMGYGMGIHVCDDCGVTIGSPIVTIGEATPVLIRELLKDREPGSYYHGWQSNIACSIVDNTDVGFEQANKVAISFLDRLIGGLGDK